VEKPGLRICYHHQYTRRHRHRIDNGGGGEGGAWAGTGAGTGGAAATTVAAALRRQPSRSVAMLCSATKLRLRCGESGLSQPHFGAMPCVSACCRSFNRQELGPVQVDPTFSALGFGS